MIKNEYDRLVMEGNLGSKIIFKPNVASTSAAPNILDPTRGLTFTKINTNLLSPNPIAPKGFWIYSKNFAFYNLNGLTGTINQYEYTLFVYGIKDSVCEKINKKLYGENITTDSVPLNMSTILSGATLTSPMPTTGAGAASTMPQDINQFRMGCFKSNTVTDNSTFFRILQLN